MACDDAVLAETANPRGYATCLVSLLEKSWPIASPTSAGRWRRQLYTALRKPRCGWREFSKEQARSDSRLEAGAWYGQRFFFGLPACGVACSAVGCVRSLDASERYQSPQTRHQPTDSTGLHLPTPHVVPAALRMSAPQPVRATAKIVRARVAVHDSVSTQCSPRRCAKRWQLNTSRKSVPASIRRWRRNFERWCLFKRHSTSTPIRRYGACRYGA